MMVAAWEVSFGVCRVERPAARKAVETVVVAVAVAVAGVERQSQWQQQWRGAVAAGLKAACESKVAVVQVILGAVIARPRS